MTDEGRPTKPPVPLRPVRGRQNSRDDLEAVAKLDELEQERRRRFEAERARRLAEQLARDADARAQETEARAKIEFERRIQRVQVDHETTPPGSKAAFKLQIRDWDKAIKFVIAVTALASLVLGIKNQADKAPVPAVETVAHEVRDVKRVVTGETDLKGASSEGEDLSSKVSQQGKNVRALVDNHCPTAQWLKQVLAHGRPPIVIELPPDCSSSSSIAVEVREEQSLPGRGPKAIRVVTPMPALSR